MTPVLSGSSLGVEGHWLGVHDGDPRAVALYRRHYSANLKHNHRHGFVGHGDKLVLITATGDALFAWKTHPLELPTPAKPDKRSLKRGDRPPARYGKEGGIICTVFRNEGSLRSSDLILEAEALAWQRWPGQRLFTYVWPAKVKSVNPGYCFKMAGWRQCGRNKDGRLVILEKMP